MKCPSCGDEIRNGRCVFCGYRPTEEDREAERRYEAQKAVFAGGRPEKAKRRAARAEPAEKKKADGAAPVPSGRKDAPGPKAEPGAKNAKAPAAKPAAKREPAKNRLPAKKGKRADGSRHGFLVRLFFRLLIVLWVLAWILAVWGKLSRDLEGSDPVDYPPDGWDQQQQYAEAYDTDGGAVLEGGIHDAQY